MTATFPGPPDVVMPRAMAWYLEQVSGGPDLTATLGSALGLWFDVVGAPQWRRPETSRLAQDPNGGPPTLLTANLTLQPRQFRVEVRLPHTSARDARQAALEAAWAARGPYLLTAPVITNSAIPVILDASQGPLEYTPSGPARSLLVAFQEVALP